MIDEKINTSDFDPFAVVQIFRKARQVNGLRLALPITIVLAGVIVAAAAMSGMLGGTKDFQPVQDFQRVFGINHYPPSKPYFPLARDVTSWYLVFVVVATCVIVHRQWQLIACCLSRLAKNGVIKPKRQLSSNRLTRVLRIDRHFDQRKPAEALNTLVCRVNELGTARIAKGAPIIALAAAILVLSLILGEKESLFHVLMPRGLNAAGQKTWVTAAYRSWWASDNHPLGFFAYFLGAFVGAYVIILQNIVGVQATYLIVALPTVVEFDADWLNRDGHYGWKPVAKAFSTVYLSLTLHGLTISLLLIVLGLQSFPWIIGLVAIWVVVTPLYLFVPWALFKRMETETRDRRIERLSQLVDGVEIDPDRDLGKLRVLTVEIDRVRHARIRPLRLLIPELSTFGIAVLLPVVLTLAQIMFSVHFGGSKPVG